MQIPLLTTERIVLTLLALGALGLAGCATNPYQSSGYAPSGSYGGAYYGYGEPYGYPGYYGYGYGLGYAYPWYPDSSSPVIENNPPGHTSPPPPQPVTPASPPPGPRHPFGRPAPLRRDRNHSHTYPP